MMALLCLGPSLVKAQEREGVKVEFLGTNNTMIRITGEGKYLMLPIQDNGEEATLNLLVDGKQEKNFANTNDGLALPGAVGGSGARASGCEGGIPRH